MVLQLVYQPVAGLEAAAQDAVGPDHVAAHLVRHADHRRLGHGGMADQRALHLGRAQAVAADLDHVVDAADDPVVAVVVLARRVAGQVPALLLEALPVLADVAGRVAVDGAGMPGQGFLITR
jgi:hypothetical protein